MHTGARPLGRSSRVPGDDGRHISDSATVFRPACSRSTCGRWSNLAAPISRAVVIRAASRARRLLWISIPRRLHRLGKRPGARRRGHGSRMNPKLVASYGSPLRRVVVRDNPVRPGHVEALRVSPRASPHQWGPRLAPALATRCQANRQEAGPPFPPCAIAPGQRPLQSLVVPPR